MLYMVELQYSQEKRDELTRYFEQRGVTGHGTRIVVKGAWVSRSRHCYILVSAGDADSFKEMCHSWSQFGEVTSTPVVDIDVVL